MPYTPPSPTINVDIEITAHGGGKPIIVGRTNLPDGFQAILSLQEGTRILGQDKIEVHSGQFSAGPFTLHGEPIRAGFTLSLSALLRLRFNRQTSKQSSALTGPSFEGHW